MSEFLGPEYLLDTPAAVELYGEVKDLPIIDAHNHADVREIRVNANYTDIWQIEGSTDHYVWSALRKCGVPEAAITGDQSHREKWLAAAAVWPELAGNPTYEWVGLDLKRLLNINADINADNAEAIWDASKAILAEESMRPQALLKTMNIEAMCSTDDPIDSLEDHQALADSEIPGLVRPTFRPDKAMNIFKPDWKEYISALEARVNGKFAKIADLLAALRVCHDYFAENGCIASDHGVEVPYGYTIDEADADAAFRKAYNGEELSHPEQVAYMSYVLNEVAALDAEKGWVFQLHMGAVRDIRDSIANGLGPDSGGDISNHAIDIVAPIRDLLNRFDGKLKVVLYCLDPGHQPTLTTLARAFGRSVRIGSAWWFNDTPVGMKQQLEYIGGIDLLSQHAGMVSDSRKLLSYASRHEMFRRCLCDVIGKMVTQGRMPMSVAPRMVRNISYDNPKQLFGL